MAQTAVITVDDGIKYQKITGFGGFVNSPQFGYGHMTTAQIKQLWGKNSETAYNIMRLYIPVGEANWTQALETAKLAQTLDIKLFASPWSMPAIWKTNNSIEGVVTVNGVEQIGYLKEEHYEDYAKYLNNFATYLRTNGVELAGISIQNEPDYKVTYAGCMWTPQQMAKFIKEYGHLINCPIIAPESVGINDNYANAFLDTAVFNRLSIYSGHQYGTIQSAYKKLQEKGMEVWMTEFLINWNANQSTTRNFNWSIDAFDFAKAINTAMLGNINAWVHYASKRYYGMMGDGTNGTQNGVVTKRGYILSHFSKYATGSTRIHSTWNDGTGVLNGSTYLSATGDSVIVMIINPSNNAYTLTVDLPFFTKEGGKITTTAQWNMNNAPIALTEETFRPKVQISASSFTTLIFKKNSIRPKSNMIGEPVYLNKIDNQAISNQAFGTSYKLSGKTVTFDNSRALISSFMNQSNGYLKIEERFNKLVFHVKAISSTLSYTSANTTLYYVNEAGQVMSHNYGTVNFNQNGGFNWILDISKNVLTDGCSGIIGLRNGNYSSVLTIAFGDVYFLYGNEKLGKFSGEYNAADSYLIDCIEDSTFTSIDFRETVALPSNANWHSVAANKNCIYYISENEVNLNTNVVKGAVCNELRLTNSSGDFFVPTNFVATSASYSVTLNGFRMLILPFEATIPAGAKAYFLELTASQVNGTRITNQVIPANTPVLIIGSGTFVFQGSGDVSTSLKTSSNYTVGTYISFKAPANSYALKTVGSNSSFNRVVRGNEPIVEPFCAYFEANTITNLANLPIVLDDATGFERFSVKQKNTMGNHTLYDVFGRPVVFPRKGELYIVNGRKIIY